MTIGIAVVLMMAALAIGAAAAWFLTPRPAPLPEVEREQILAAARTEAEQRKRAAELEAKEIAFRAEERVADELKQKRAELEKQKLEMARREDGLSARFSELEQRDQELGKRERTLGGREQAAEATARRAEESLGQAKVRLEKLAGITAADAQEQLRSEVIEAARQAAAGEIRTIEEQARVEAESRSKQIITTAIQRFASEYVGERTVSVVSLPSDDLKGRIIGREGRNIRALEAATGIDLIIDDTPEAVIISCFNPVRREVAKLALTRLIADGRIHPTRIEEVVQKCEAEIEHQAREAGEQAVFDLGLGRLHPELVRLLGKLKFRSTFAQNLLQHSIEVGFLAGVMAGELGVNVKLARRAGLLHDIGKAADQESEGAHWAVGAMLAKKFGEPREVVHAIAAHHASEGGEERPESLLDHVVDACNVLSGQRPGARRETLQSYITRLEDLEKLCTSYPGVEKAYAIQMGKEVRILVEAARVSDQQAFTLSKEIAKRIEGSLTYAGQIKVNVIRETRATDYAK